MDFRRWFHNSTWIPTFPYYSVAALLRRVSVLRSSTRLDGGLQRKKVLIWVTFSSNKRLYPKLSRNLSAWRGLMLMTALATLTIIMVSLTSCSFCRVAFFAMRCDKNIYATNTWQPKLLKFVSYRCVASFTMRFDKSIYATNVVPLLTYQPNVLAPRRTVRFLAYLVLNLNLAREFSAHETE